MRISGITYAPPRTHKARTFFKILLLVFLLALLVSASTCFYIGWSLTHPAKDTNTSFLNNLNIPKYKEAVFHDTKNTVSLKGWYFQTGTSDRTVILAHGYSSNKFQYNEKTIDMVKNFLDKNYNILLFDFRYSGFSGGSASTVGYYEKYDLLGAIQYAKSEGAKHVVILGVSMGASTGILAAAESADVDAVIADTPFANLNDFLQTGLSNFSPLPSVFNKPTLWTMWLITGSNPKEVDVLKALSSVSPRPILFIHSVNDPSIPISNSRDLYHAYAKFVGEKAQLWETDGVKHADTYRIHPTEYMSRVFDFLLQVYPAP